MLSRYLLFYQVIERITQIELIMRLFLVNSMSLKMSSTTTLVAFWLKSLTPSHFLQKKQKIGQDWALDQGSLFFMERQICVSLKFAAYFLSLSEKYLEPSRTSIMDLAKNSIHLNTVNYFCKKASP